jgi:hypothetical protein
MVSVYLPYVQALKLITVFTNFILCLKLYHSSLVSLEKEKQNLSRFYLIYAIIPFAGFLNAIIDVHNSLAGVAQILLLFGNIFLHSYSMYYFYPENMAQVPKKKHYSLMKMYIIVGSTVSIYGTVLIVKYTGYEAQGGMLPIPAYVCIAIWIWLHLVVYILVLQDIRKNLKSIYRYKNRVEINQYIMLVTKFKFIAIAIVILFVSNVLLILDVIYTERTALAVFGWIFMLMGIIGVYFGTTYEEPVRVQYPADSMQNRRADILK